MIVWPPGTPQKRCRTKIFDNFPNFFVILYRNFSFSLKILHVSILFFLFFLRETFEQFDFCAFEARKYSFCAIEVRKIILRGTNWNFAQNLLAKFVRNPLSRHLTRWVLQFWPHKVQCPPGSDFSSSPCYDESI